MFLEPITEPVIGRSLHHGLHRRVPELRLGLSLELRLTKPNRDDRSEAFTNVFAGEVVVLLLEKSLGSRVPVHDRGQGSAEALHMCPALNRGDAIGKRMQSVGLVSGVPLERDLDLLGLFEMFVVADA